MTFEAPAPKSMWGTERDMTMLPCGCVYWTEGKFFWLDPCKDPKCKYRRFIYEESARRKHPLVEKRI